MGLFRLVAGKLCFYFLIRHVECILKEKLPRQFEAVTAMIVKLFEAVTAMIVKILRLSQ